MVMVKPEEGAAPTVPATPGLSRPARQPLRPGLGRTSERAVLLVASFGAVLAFLDVTIVNVAFPSIRASYSTASIETVSWVLNAYNIVFAAFLIVFGRVGDLIGRRRLYLAGIGLFTLSSLVCAVAPSVGVLIGARVFEALGAAMLVPASLALVIERFPIAKRSHAVGLWGAAAAVAAGLGPPAGGLLVKVGGWQWAFWVNLPLGLIALWFGRRHLVESRSPGRRRVPDLLGALLLAGALGLLTTAIIKQTDWGMTSARVWSVVAGALLLGVGFAISSKRHPSPVLDPAMMRSRPFLVANIATLAAGVGFFAYMLTNVLWLQYIWHYSVLASGLALVPGAVAAAIVAGLLEPIAARYHFRWIIVGGFVVWALAFVWYVHGVGLTPRFLSQWLPAQVLSGIGVGATMPLLGSATLATQPGGRFGTASAVISSARQVGGVIGLAILVAILGTPTAQSLVGDLRGGWTMSLVCFLAGAVITVFMGPVQETDSSSIDLAPQAARLHRPPATPVSRPIPLPPPIEESLFARLPAATRERIMATAPRRSTSAGDWLMRAGDVAESMYVLLSGRAEIVVDGQVVRQLGPGSVIGELGLLTGRGRSASVRARRDCCSLEVSRTMMDETIASDPAALSQLITGLATQLADARPTATAPMRPSLVAVVAGTAGAPTQTVAAALQESIAAHDRVVLMGGEPSVEELDHAERDVPLVIVVESSDDPSWLERCAREADLVVVVADPAAPPRSLPPVGARPELVLLGGASREAVQQWSDRLTPWRITQLRSAGGGTGACGNVTLASGLRDLGNRLTGRSIGIVLGGGGARAITHIGVLLELEEQGVHVDRIAGASMGATIAGMWATRTDDTEWVETAYRELVRERPLGDYRLPRTSLARGARVRRGLERVFGDVLIEELPSGFRCVSTDLISRSSVLHQHGPLVDAVNASMQLPILFPPIPSGERLLIDGGVLDNLPVDALCERDEGPIVAINVAFGSGSHHDRARTQPRRRQVRVPMLGETLLRVLMIGGGEVGRAQQLGAWVITPDAMGVGLLELHQFDRMVESGRAAARSLLEQTDGDLRAGGLTGQVPGAEPQ